MGTPNYEKSTCYVVLMMGIVNSPADPKIICPNARFERGRREGGTHTHNGWETLELQHFSSYVLF